MKRLHDSPLHSGHRVATRGCNHPLAFVIDPTESELRELEQMLANCPSCSRWSPGDGPIMAIVSTGDATTPRRSFELAARWREGKDSEHE
jgi:hypothetical protein